MNKDFGCILSCQPENLINTLLQVLIFFLYKALDMPKYQVLFQKNIIFHLVSGRQDT